MTYGWKMPLIQQMGEMAGIMVQLSKRKYLEQYGSIKNKNIVIAEVKNKWGHIFYSANWMVATCTVRSILQQASQSQS